MKVEMSASCQTYQVGAHFKALNKAILVALSRFLEKYFFISCHPAALLTSFLKWLIMTSEFFSSAALIISPS